ncbi:inositol monophosphatase family protein [Sulfitobacter mediterraneus]|uniref:inositol monophosphatase family protein n=1 Tax=Sulfitobacter mediterraneus TaxID=83219 RepID=UPI0021A72622|nr:inositol monophosphatase [Sulfitobacter mediterraneus]UWR11002.1 inositol monophosphatase [Sulfitobacter mediterraneus]
MTQDLPAPLPPALRPAQQQHVLNIVRRAAKAEILPRFRALAAAEISSKSRPDDLVTTADLQAEAMITRALKIAFPDALVIGEEAVAKDPSLLDGLANAPLAFIIDPVDGTWNFAHGLAVFGVILAVTQFGKPGFGLIYDPLADDWAIADSATGLAELQKANGNGSPLRVAMGKQIENLSGYIPLSLFEGPVLRQVAATLPSFARVTSLRCSAHEYRMVAQGHVDFLLTGMLHPWDHAAGALICAQAGAHVEMLDGGPYSAARRNGHLLVAPDRTTWNRLRKVFDFLVVEEPGGT